MLTSEYFVLDGATALAIPTKFGQTLTVYHSQASLINWKSFDEKDIVWFEACFDMKFQLVSSSNENTAKTLQKILQEAQKENPDFLDNSTGFEVHTKLDFPRDWGMGTSSTLINNIAQWAEINAFKLLENSFGGSGYDIACAQNPFPILYSNREKPPFIKKAALDWPFKDHLFFVHLKQKQSSKEAIEHYKKTNPQAGVDTMSALTEQILLCDSLSQFEIMLNAHENFISKTLQLPKIKDHLFPDFNGSIKSLGAWGGDFILATGSTTETYFKQKGYDVIIPFKEMIKS